VQAGALYLRQCPAHDRPGPQPGLLRMGDCG